MELLFRGRFDVAIDDKSRFRLPAALRGGSSKERRFVITNNFVGGEKCLDLHTHNAFRKLEAQIARLPQMKKEVQVFQRYYLSAAHLIEIDASGRLLLPSMLREHAGLSAEAVLVGMGSKVEIWDKAVWKKLEQKIELEFENSQKVISEI